MDDQVRRLRGETMKLYQCCPHINADPETLAKEFINPAHAGRNFIIAECCRECFWEVNRATAEEQGEDPNVLPVLDWMGRKADSISSYLEQIKGGD